MKLRTARLLVTFGSFVAGLILVAAVLLLAAGRDGASKLPQVAAIGGPFSLTDQDGRTVTDQNLKGRPFLVFFGFTHCPDICPTSMFEISEILRKLGPDGDRMGAVFITVDPERDTPAALKDYMSSFDPRMIALTGDEASIAAVAKAYRAYYKRVPLAEGGYTMDHTAIVYLMGKDGRFVSPFSLKRTSDAAAADLRKYL
ncbi:MAG: redoxin domain-containing protein [Rhizobiales bacterium]|nr:redoxin domain-containing protein [Hyphomicrobiales bacterium]